MNNIFKISSYILLCLLLGIGIGYFLFGKIGKRYVSVSWLLKPTKNILHSGFNKVTGVNKMRQKILVCGGAGALAGAVLALTLQMNKRR
ncbi:MAG: hypothetical protein A2096_06580 [Spirochaetes bacterium GWF1_41_5]|nr:MAG: hypothetical protein A2096_06580 [Spirochaetes bacterium GWF1_41_5]HBE01408.1 hypothetical protein [Spirochaetia bacterium]